MQLKRVNHKNFASYIEFCIEYKLSGIAEVFVGDESVEDLRQAMATQEALEAYAKEFLALDEKNHRGIGLKEGYVPATQYWLVEDEKVIGIASLRHYLTPALEVYAGHIGYGIRLGLWGKGYATILLGLMLKEAAKYGIKSATITCNATNIASRRVIEKNGGQYIDTFSHRLEGKARETYRFLADTGMILYRACQISAGALLSTEITDGQIRLAPSKSVNEYGRIISCYFNIFVGFVKVGWIVFRIAGEQDLYFDGNFGYFIDREYRGRHYTEKAMLLLKEKLKYLGICCTYITADTDNKISRRVCEAVGAHFLEVAKKDKLVCRYRWML